MRIIRTLHDATEYFNEMRQKGVSIGFVPTMGALHEGHLSLIDKMVSENEVGVVSIFVNPAQFNNPSDLASYPRDEENDFRLLAAHKVTAVFAPMAEEIYPEGVACGEINSYKLGHYAEVMEGKHRPGHFQGVAHIVNYLFRLINPDRAYFGEKDFQQIAVIRELVRNEGLKVDIIACPIKRDSDGLALSSRNALLSSEERKVAPEIHAALQYSVDYSRDHSVRATHDTVVERIEAIPGMRVEYFEIIDGRTLLPVEEWEESPWIVGCITVWCGVVRLIDNITYKNPS